MSVQLARLRLVFKGQRTRYRSFYEAAALQKARKSFLRLQPETAKPSKYPQPILTRPRLACPVSLMCALWRGQGFGSVLGFRV